LVSSGGPTEPRFRSSGEADASVEVAMLGWALTFLVIGLIAAMLGFTSIAGASFAIAKFIAAVFLVLFVVFLVLGVTAFRKITS
jgi:uncharacterized membrane protein YtjA (UPF0391 family)